MGHNVGQVRVHSTQSTGEGLVRGAEFDLHHILEAQHGHPPELVD